MFTFSSGWNIICLLVNTNNCMEDFKMLVSYTGFYEVLVIDKKDEEKFLKEYFSSDSGRDLDSYDRDESDYCLEITSSLTTNRG